MNTREIYSVIAGLSEEVNANSREGSIEAAASESVCQQPIYLISDDLARFDAAGNMLPRNWKLVTDDTLINEFSGVGRSSAEPVHDANEDRPSQSCNIL